MATLQAVRGGNTTQLESLPSSPTTILFDGCATIEEPAGSEAPESPNQVQTPSQLNRPPPTQELTSVQAPALTESDFNGSKGSELIRDSTVSPRSPTSHISHDSIASERLKNKFGAIARIVRQQYHWPNPQDSIGTSCRLLGSENLKCWEAKGPALELTRDLVPEILKHLNCCKEDVYGDKSVRRLLGFGVYMVGKSEADARPFLIVSGDRDPRRKAVKLIQESKVLEKFRDRGGVALREVSKPPISDGFVAMAAGCTEQSFDTVSEESNVVFYDLSYEMRNGHGLLLYTSKRSSDGVVHMQKATVGCILCLRGNYLAWTAAHAFIDIPFPSHSSGSSYEESSLDFAFDDESEVVSIEFGKVASDKRTSYHSAASVENGMAASVPQPNSINIPTDVFLNTSSLPSQTAMFRTDDDLQLEVFGSLLTSCNHLDHAEQNLDWALIEITNSEFQTTSTIEAINGPRQLVICDDRPYETEVFAATGSGGLRRGQLSAMPTYLMLPLTTIFQEVWTVRFEKSDKPLATGDCGSLAIDSNGCIFGHLVAGDLENRVGYIIPAAQTFEDMKRRVGDDLSIPQMNALTTPLATLSARRAASQETLTSSKNTLRSTRSISDSDIVFLEIHGRRYCQYYYMPNDADEQMRLQMIHSLCLRAFDNKLTTVPLSNPSKILDIGAGTGGWAMSMADEYPNAEIIGTDIANIMPSCVPINVFFEVDDAEEEGGWTWAKDQFDLVHLRFMTGAFMNWKHIYMEAYKHLKPGGWIEVVELDDRSLLGAFEEDSVVKKWFTALNVAMQKSGRPRSIDHLRPDELSGLGFTDVKTTSYSVPMGVWPESKEELNVGKLSLIAQLYGIEALCLRPLTEELGWKFDEVRTVVELVTQEIDSLGIDSKKAKGLSLSFKVLVARKPHTSVTESVH